MGVELSAQVKYWAELEGVTINEWVKRSVELRIEEEKSNRKDDERGGINYD
jgi:enoyl reductase-like protein